MKSDNILTVIIVFLNEREEVKNTIDSLINHLDSQIDIIIINDYSDDGYDYQFDINEYNLFYIENEERLGVAASRDKGVEWCRTPYFLFLDAHMRFYDKKWYDSLIYELSKDEFCIICSQTRFLKKLDENVIEDIHVQPTYGAYIHLQIPERFFELQWLYTQSFDEKGENVILIPCLIGAAYATNKRFWHYLHGLWGLEKYGLDEAYLSVKTYLSGGTCKLMKNFVTGHIYRQHPPYFIDDISQLHNKILLMLLLVSPNIQKKCFANYRTYYYSYYEEAMRSIHNKFNEIYRLKLYYTTIFNKTFSSFYDCNYKSLSFYDNSNKNSQELILVSNCVVNNLSYFTFFGLVEGCLGAILFLFHYARFSGVIDYYNLAHSYLYSILSKPMNVVNLKEGVIGIGWSIQYLFQYGFITYEEYLELDNLNLILLLIKEMSREDLNFFTGFGGVVRYVLAKLYVMRIYNLSLGRELIDCVIDIYGFCRDVIEQKKATDCIETYMEFIWYYEHCTIINPQSSIYDILYIFTPKEYEVNNMALGLDGLSGIGLDMIFKKEFHSI